MIAAPPGPGQAERGSLAGPAVPPPRQQPRPRLLLTASGLVAAVLLLPLAFLILEAIGAGRSSLLSLIFRGLTATLLWNTVELTVVVTIACAIIGTAAAWCVERTDLPGRRVWAVLVVVPLAIPDFVVSFGWNSLSTWVQGFQGAVLVMTLAVYPLVYLPVAASFRGADPGQEEIARSLGVGRLATFWKVTLAQARLAILGGCLLVALVILAEFGAFEILGYQTFTTEIFNQFDVEFNIQSACALALILVALSLVVITGEASSRGSARAHQPGSRPGPSLRRQRLGRGTIPTLLLFGLLALAALGVPVGASIYWIFEGGAHYLSGVPLLAATGYTVLYSASAALLSTLMALPVAVLVIRHPGRARLLLERSTFLVLAMPGLVVALAISYFAERYANGFLYQSAPLLILAYAIMFFPLALVGVRASVLQAPRGLEEVAQSLGVGRARVLWRVTFPLVGPGLGAAFCLVFLSAVTELTATLILVPTGVQTLATQFWAYQQNLSYGQAAPFALMIICIAALPSYILGRFFDRRGAQVGGGDVTSLQIDGLYKAFGRLQVLKGLALTVPSGSFTAVLGPSGSGKTTLLRVIAGIERADSGLVQLGGRVVDDGQRYVPSDRRRVGYVPQEGSLFPHLNVAQNVGFGMDRQRRRSGRVDELLEMVGLAGLGRRYAHQLSGGQRQRVALARTLAIDPEVVLLDEPFSSLEASLRASVRADVRRVLLKAGATAILVTHDQEEALSLADRVATIRDGQIGQYDTPQALYSRPADPQLAKSLGESNLLSGVVENGGVSTRLGMLEIQGGTVRAGDRVVVLIRPEQIELGAPGTGSGPTATVSEYEYYGHDAIVRLRPAWAHALPLVVRTSDTAAPLSVGSKVDLSVCGQVVTWRASAEEVGGLIDQPEGSPTG